MIVFMNNKIYVFLIITLFTSSLFGCQQRKEGAADEQYIDEDKEIKEEYPTNVWTDGQVNEFVMYASMLDIAQIRIGEMAMEKGATAEIQNYGKLLKEDHKSSLARLKDIVEDKDMNIPDTLGKDFNQMILELQNARGSGFDRKLLDLMIKDHKKAIAKFENAKEHISNEDPINDWLDNSLPALHRHEQKAKQLQRALNLEG